MDGRLWLVLLTKLLQSGYNDYVPYSTKEKENTHIREYRATHMEEKYKKINEAYLQGAKDFRQKLQKKD